jgi:hypothetical protein
MTHLTDDELGDVLTETFTAHEHLADPDVAVAIARAPGRPRQLGRILLGAAAAVALVAGGTTYVVTREAGPVVPVADPTGGPTATSSTGAGPIINTDAENLVYTRALVAGLRAKLLASAPLGARPATADQVAPLKHLTTFSGPFGGHPVQASLFWLVPGQAKDLARWYVRHPLPGYRADGAGPDEGPDGGIGGSSLRDGGWSNDVSFYAPGAHSVQGAANIQLQTTEVGGETGVRATIFGAALPPRLLASYVEDARSVSVTLTTSSQRNRSTPRVRSWQITDPQQVARIARAYNGLAGTLPVVHSCPMMLSVKVYRVVFHTGDGDVAVRSEEDCFDELAVSRNGRAVSPMLASGHLVTDLLNF